MFHKEHESHTEKCREHLPDYLHLLSFDRNNTDLQNLFLKYLFVVTEVVTPRNWSKNFITMCNTNTDAETFVNIGVS